MVFIKTIGPLFSRIYILRNHGYELKYYKIEPTWGIKQKCFYFCDFVYETNLFFDEK